MNLEQIDTSTTAGKARVMQLAAEGRRVAYSNAGHHEWALARDPRWDWRTRDYAIIAEPVGPDEVWVNVTPSFKLGRAEYLYGSCATAAADAYTSEVRQVRYIRADLAGGDA
ncbi:hypothetical protein [Stenotrophomonas rhizophila]|uniref:hypothetical protein n=1 Tax=Stenotrophomonas rhizophila TaxID=216778 RepID=UPI00112F68B0|nr:hypothetical protein [Stenotrophomonas rhizophila]